MSTGNSARTRSRSSVSATSAANSVKRTAPGPVPTLTPENADEGLTPCAATNKLFLCAQGNTILVLRHETLAIERRFTKHKEDVAWIAVDNVSVRSGKLAVSYDTGNTAIIWEIYSGNEISRFAAYDPIRAAAWMRNGNIAFGNSTGSIILFDPGTSEHVSSRTIYDPVTALAPSPDCRTFAIGYLNGSILICMLEPSFTILHTLTTQKSPSRITGIGWHGSSAKSKMDMLVTQSADGDLRVWSVPKSAGDGLTCSTIRTLGTSQGIPSGPNWCSWSRTGRVVQHSDRQTRLHDVRTKNVVMTRLATPEDLVGIATHGPSSALVVMGRNHIIQQWNINPEGEPYQVCEVQHVPAKPPPSPPGSVTGSRTGTTLPPVLPTFTDSEASGNEGRIQSPLRRIARELDDLEAAKERRDKLTPLSPGSSRSSVSSGTRSPNGRRLPAYMYDKPPSRTSIRSRDSTEFSIGQSLPRLRESASIRSGSASYRSSAHRREMGRSSAAPDNEVVELFPFTMARLHEVKFCTPEYGNGSRTPDMLRREMLRVVFGWSDDIRPLIRDEMLRHAPGSSRAVLLAKWLGELESDLLVSMMGSENLTSSDWMLLALGSIGKDSQKKVGEAFVQRLLEKSDVHAAVAVLLGLNEFDDAIETYVSQKFYAEALLLTCLTAPADWGRQAFLLNKWGQVAVQNGSPELAVRIFSCASIESSGPWTSPRAKQAVRLAQKEQGLNEPSGMSPTSPPSAGGSGRMTAKNAALKLITTFGDKGVPLPQANPKSVNTSGAGPTPIAQSAMSPDGRSAWPRDDKKEVEPESARSTRTATPGGYGRKRQPSLQRSKTPNDVTPQTTTRDFAVPSLPVPANRSDAASPAKQNAGARQTSDHQHLPSPAAGAFTRIRGSSRARNGSRDRMPQGLHLRMVETAYLNDAVSPPLPTHSTSQSNYSLSSAQSMRTDTASPPLSGVSNPSIRGRAAEPFISSLEQARIHARQQRREGSKARAESKTRRRKDRSESRGRHEVQYIPRAKRSPSSPVPMSPEEVLAASRTDASGRGEARRPDLRQDGRVERAQLEGQDGPTDPTHATLPLVDDNNRGRGHSEKNSILASVRSPSAPPSPIDEDVSRDANDVSQSDKRPRLRSLSRGARSASLTRIKTVNDLHSAVRQDSVIQLHPIESEAEGEQEDDSTSPDPRYQRDADPRKKEIAAKELEDRRLSLTRRPSAPAVPLPGETSMRRPSLPRFNSEHSESPTSFLPSQSFSISPVRSKSVDPESQSKGFTRDVDRSGQPVHIGLPATPKALMNRRQMLADLRGDAPPPVPPVPAHVDSPSAGLSSDDDKVGDLLPSTTFGMPVPESRAASAPVDQAEDQAKSRPFKASMPSSLRRESFTRGHIRSQTYDASMISQGLQRSPPIVTASIDETIHDSQVTVEELHDPPLLPELQHLAGPPPPPPVPILPGASNRNSAERNLSSVDLAMDGQSQSRGPTPILPAERATTNSPVAQVRRGRGSISDGNKGLGNRIRTAVTERMRSTSRSNNKSPPMSSGGGQSPYETVLPSYPPTATVKTHSRRGSLGSLRTKSPYESGLARTGTAPTSTSTSNLDILPPGAQESNGIPGGRHGSIPGASGPGTAHGEQSHAPNYVNTSLPPSRSLKDSPAGNILPATTFVLPSSTARPAAANRSGSFSAGSSDFHGGGGGTREQRPPLTTSQSSYGPTTTTMTTTPANMTQRQAGYTPTPREIRANMPPELLKSSVYVPPLDTRDATVRNDDNASAATVAGQSSFSAGPTFSGGGGGRFGTRSAGTTPVAGNALPLPASGGKLRKVNREELKRAEAEMF